MKMVFYNRNFQRTVHDDFVLNVQSYMQKGDGAFPVYNNNNEMIGWVVKPMY